MFTNHQWIFKLYLVPLGIIFGLFVFTLLFLTKEVSAQLNTFDCKWKIVGGDCIISYPTRCDGLSNCIPQPSVCSGKNAATCNASKGNPCNCGAGAPIFGTVNRPPGVAKYSTGGISQFLGNIVKFLIVIAGIWSLFNFVLAGYGYLGASGDPKKIQDATSKITMTVVGLSVAAGAVILAAIFGKLIFGDYRALLQVRVFGP